MASFGKYVINNHGNRVFWLLYLGGALSGAFCMQLFRPHNSIVIPEVGAGPAVSSILTFYAMSNLHQTVFFFAIPIKMWVILGFVAFSALTDPSKKDFGGMLTGLLVHQIFKIRMWNSTWFLITILFTFCNLTKIKEIVLFWNYKFFSDMKK